MDIRALPGKKPAYIVAVLIGLFVLYTFLSSYGSIPPYQWSMVFALLLISALVYIVLDRGMLSGTPAETAVIVLLYAATGLILFHPTIDNIFRSDYWFIFALFEKMGGLTLQNIKALSVFEFMGDLRFQPLAHILIYIRYIIFQDNIVLFHLSNIILHAATGILIFLVIKKITRDVAFSFIFGLVFVALQSQFDIVVWTYHLYIIIGVISFLAAVFMALRYSETEKSKYLYFSILLSLISIFLYEPSILAPAAVFLIVLFSGAGGKSGLRRLAFPAALAILAYLVYMAITLYGMTLISQGDKMGMASMLTWQNLTLAVKGVLVNLWESTFLKNTGITAHTVIMDIVYMALPENPYGTLINIVKIVLSLLLISFFRLSRENRSMVFILSLVALSYIFIISLGRVHTNSIKYLVSQPRYQYLDNAIVLIITASLLVGKYRQKEWKPLIAMLLAAIFFWNCQNVLYANNMVDEEMDFLNAPYYRIKGFLEEDPSARIFINYAPFNRLRFFLGSDIAFDMLFGERVTRLSQKATHIFDGKIFKVNKGYGEAKPSPYLEDFNISWAYTKVIKKDVSPQDLTVVGSNGSYPRISLTPDGHVEVQLRDAASNEIDTYRLSQPPSLPPERFAKMEVIKAKDRLCLRVNGVISDTLLLRSRYDQWDEDGKELLGDYYTGRGSASYVTMLFITHEREAIKCM